MLTKVAGFAFAVIEVLLLLRLVLPYVHWPSTVDAWIPKLVDVTNALAAPFQPVIKTLDLQASSGGVLTQYTNKLDPGVLVAMIGWSLIALAVLAVLSQLSRAR